MKRFIEVVTLEASRVLINTDKIQRAYEEEIKGEKQVVLLLTSSGDLNHIIIKNHSLDSFKELLEQ